MSYLRPAGHNGLKKNKSIKKLDMSSNALCCNFDAEIYEYELKALVALRQCLEANMVIEDIDLSDNGLFGLPLRYTSSHNPGGSFQPDSCSELCMAIHGNTKAGGNLRVLNILKNRMEACKSLYSHGPIKTLETSLRQKHDLSVGGFVTTIGLGEASTTFIHSTS